MSIKTELLSSLLEKHTLIIIELQRLNALFVHYSDTGARAKLVQISDSMKRLDLSKQAIAIEIDKRIPVENLGQQSDGYTTD